jgi:dihydroorotate dehydrogenase (NAD+) catalytic subunit
MTSSELTVQFGPLTLAHPFINASGTMNLFDLAETLGRELLERPPVAAYVPKTITLERRLGNSPPRILETPAGMVNAIGLTGEGLDAFVERQLPGLLALPCPVILSVGGFCRQDYVGLASGLRVALSDRAADWPARLGLELNISCPNVHSGCLAIGSDADETAALVSAVREEWQGLLIAKLTPNVTDIAAIAAAAATAGVDAVSAVNTYKALVIDRRTLKPFLGNKVGGMSGPAIKALALRAVYDIAEKVDIPIVGMGGVACIQDALDFMACGASVVAVGSAGLENPWLAAELATELGPELVARGISLSELVGVAHSRAN